MCKKIVLCFIMVCLLVTTSIPAFAINSDAPMLKLTEDEKEYFSQFQTLRVLTVPNIQPYSYGNTGVSIDILEHLCEAADVTLQLIETQSYSDALVRLENGEADLCAVKISAFENASDILPYLDAPLQTVRHKQFSPSEQSGLSIAQIQGLDIAYDEKHSFINTVNFSSLSECLDAVRGRQADIFLGDIYQVSVFSESFSARELITSTVPQREVSVGFGLSKNIDERLVSALQSAINSFSASQLSTSLSQHVQYHDMGFDILQFVYENPFELLCALMSLFFVILLCIFVFFRIKISQQQQLRGYEESYRMLADTFGDAGLEYDFLSDRCTLFGEHHDKLDLPEVVEQVHLALEQGALRISLSAEEFDKMLNNSTSDHSNQIELQCGLKEGNWNWFRMIYIVVCTSESHRRPIRLIGCLVDIENEHRERERLLKIGYHDQLTDLFNRASGENEIMLALNADDAPKVLLFLDIDYFKLFNDRYGHSCGDAVLVALSDALRDVFSQNAVLCRWGGDEFILLVKGNAAQEDCLYAHLKELQKRMRNFTYLGLPLVVTLSIGGTVAFSDMPFQTIFELADEALYTVKKQGRDHYRIIFPTQNATDLHEEAKQ